jgi:integrase
MLVIARKRGLIAAVPEIDWLKVPPQEFDFLDFEEADRLLAAVDVEWRTMVLVVLRTGMRMGELIALRWQDVDLVAGKITVRQNAVKGKIGTPKSGKAREIALSNEAVAALKAHRHLRGPLVFCTMDGHMLKYTGAAARAVEGVQEGRAADSAVALTAPWVRESPGDAWRAAQGGAGAAGARDDPDDALRALSC